MTVAQLVRAWACELAAPEYGDPQHFEQDLLHTLMEDVVNGRLDTAAMKPIARCGYDEYAVVESVFAMPRPTK